MKRRFFAVSLPLFAGLACVLLASQVLGALPPPTPVALSDLVIKQVSYTKYTPHGDIAGDIEFAVRVKNIGKGTSPACTVVLDCTWNIQDPKSGKIGSLQFPTLAPGATAERKVTLYTIAFLPLKAMLIAAVDPAVAGKPSGQVLEGSAGELNNVFGFTFTIPSSTPITWMNPAVP